MKISFKTQVKKSLGKTREILIEEYKKSSFQLGSHNKVKLNKSLAAIRLYDLQETTLLTPEIHAIHSLNLADKYIAKLDSLVNAEKKPYLKNYKSQKSKFRFLTLLNTMELMDVNKTLNVIDKFKSDLTSAVEESRGIWCLGAIEIEVVNINVMRSIKDSKTDSETRKLDVCESMIKNLKKKDQYLSSFFLVHFHGIVVSNTESNFHNFRDVLKKNRLWKKEPRQIQLKPLSEHFGNKPKPVDKSLKDIARYITKGGNDWIANKAYLRYKLAFDNEHFETQDEWVQRNWRRNEVLKQERHEEGIKDAFSMTVQEIGLLARVIDRMMGSKRDRNGYLVSAKSKRKLITTED